MATPVYQDDLVALYLGDCVDVMAEMPEASIDAVVTDPPYNLGFMGREWDRKHEHDPWARAAFRVAKPGAHLLSFGGTRTYHRMTVALEDAGWEIRDCLVWGYAHGFPKGLDVSKAIDRELGVEREVVGVRSTKMVRFNPGLSVAPVYVDLPITKAGSPEAAEWEGWKSALKPAWEPIVMARKPMEGRLVDNVLKHGVGALNIDGTRLLAEDSEDRPDLDDQGRWTPNMVITDPIFGPVEEMPPEGYSRFFMLPKANGAEREPGMRVEGQPDKANIHPTVKPVDLMRHLVRLVTPKHGVVLDCFLGSGTTAIAANQEGFRCIGIEREPQYMDLARARLPGEPLGIGLL